MHGNLKANQNQIHFTNFNNKYVSKKQLKKKKKKQQQQQQILQTSKPHRS